MKRRTLLIALSSLPAILLAGPHGPSTSRGAGRPGGPLDPRRIDDQENVDKQEPETLEDKQEQGDGKPAKDDKEESN